MDMYNKQIVEVIVCFKSKSKLTIVQTNTDTHTHRLDSSKQEQPVMTQQTVNLCLSAFVRECLIGIKTQSPTVTIWEMCVGVRGGFSDISVVFVLGLNL